MTKNKICYPSSDEKHSLNLNCLFILFLSRRIHGSYVTRLIIAQCARMHISSKYIMVPNPFQIRT